MFVAYLIGLVYTVVRRVFFNHVIIDGFELQFEIDETFNPGNPLVISVSHGDVYDPKVPLIQVFIEEDLHLYFS